MITPSFPFILPPPLMVFTSQPLFFAALSVPRNTIGLPPLQPSRLVSSILTLIRLVLLPNCPPRPLLLYPIPSTHSLTIPFFPTTTFICLLSVLIQHIRSRSVAFCLNPQRTISYFKQISHLFPLRRARHLQPAWHIPHLTTLIHLLYHTPGLQPWRSLPSLNLCCVRIPHL